MKVALLALLIALFCCSQLSAQESVVYAHRDTIDLSMTIYVGKFDQKQPETIIYLFGGGFMKGSRQSKIAVDYCRRMQERGFTTIAIDYRLGLKGKHSKGMAFVNDLEQAIRMAVEDLSSATHYIIEHADSLGVEPDKIVITGSSAGAVTVLEADYCLANHSEWTKELSAGFRFAGVMAYAGAVFTRQSPVSYSEAPVPTLFYHGTADKVVEYNKIQVGRIGLFGTKPLVDIFQTAGYPYRVRRFTGLGHEVCEFGNYEVDDAVMFIETWVRRGSRYSSDETFHDPDHVTRGHWSSSAKELYNKNK